MKVGDKLKYKGGMNPFSNGYRYVNFNKIYEIIAIDGQCIGVQLDNDVKWVFTPDGINEMFTPLIESKDNHYDNTNGSLYKFAVDHNLNAFEFDAIKRIVRCRKKGQFKEDLEKTIRVIELYLKEME